MSSEGRYATASFERSRKLSTASQRMFASKKSTSSSIVKEKIIDVDKTEGTSSPSSHRTDTPKDLIEAQTYRRVACCHFMELLFFMFAFLWLMWLHEDIEQTFVLQNMLNTEVSQPFGQHSKTVRDIEEVEQMWQWMDITLFPLLINHKDEAGHYLPRGDWGYLAQYNRVIGGIKMVQSRSKERGCEYDLDQFYGNCQPIHTHDHRSFGYPECKGTNSTNTTTHTDDDASSTSYNITACFNREDYEGAVDFYHDEGFTMNKKDNIFEMWIDLIDDENKIWKRQRYLKDRHWIDRQTKELKIEVLIYNAQEQPLISRARITFQFNRVGYIVPSVDIKTMALSPYFSQGMLKIILEAMYVILLLDRSFNMIQELNSRIKKHKQDEPNSAHHYGICQSLKDQFWSEGAGSWLELINVAFGYMICLEWTLFVMNMRIVENRLASLHRPSGKVQYDDNDADVWSEYHHDISNIEDDIDEVVFNMSLIKGFAMVIVFAMIFEFFRVLEGIPALKRMGDTISIASSNLLSFSLVIICLVTLFAGAGMLAFGQKMTAFHNMYNAIMTTLIIVTTGSSEIYGEQFKLSPIIASIWYWLLVTIMYLVCLRLILCILMDAYGEASEAAERDGSEVGLFEQGYDTLSHLFDSGFKNLKQYLYGREPTDSQEGSESLKSQISTKVSVSAAVPTDNDSLVLIHSAIPSSASSSAFPSARSISSVQSSTSSTSSTSDVALSFHNYSARGHGYYEEDREEVLSAGRVVGGRLLSRVSENGGKEGRSFEVGEEQTLDESREEEEPNTKKLGWM